MTEPNRSTGPSAPRNTIAAAIEDYSDSCKLTENPPFYEMVSTLIDRGCDEDFKNDSFFDALCLTHTMFMKSFSNVRILTGGGGTSFWRTLEKPFATAADHLRKTGGKIRMIVLDPSPECIAELKRLSNVFGEVFEFVMATAKKPVNHFIVCDSKMLRIEEPHEPIDEKTTPANSIRANVNFKDVEKATRQERIFDNIWNSLKPTVA